MNGILPKAWKHAIILPIAKPGKDSSVPSNYRPISLTNVLCKTMEKLVTNRLTWYLESNDLLNNAQTGFRKGRSTVDQVIKLQDRINKYIRNKGYSLGVFLDFEKAYDMLWRPGLLNKLKSMHINGCMFQWIIDFVSERIFQVSVGAQRSTTRCLKNGTPQGSVISPILFLIMINDMKTKSDDVSLSLFADDSATYNHGHDVDLLIKQMQKTLDGIQQWCDEWGFKL